MRLSQVFLVILAFALFACRDYGVPATSTNTQLLYSFKYKSYDSQGAPYTTGTLNLWIDKSHVTGYWRMDNRESGILAGSIGVDSIQIDLYPGYDDQHLILTGRISGNAFAGEWTKHTSATATRGTFVATM